jgi:voltage-gated potassium channel
MATRSNELKNSTYEVFIGALSVLSIVNIFLYFVIPDDAVESVVLIIDGILSLIFLTDFTLRLFTAESKRHYFFRQFGWADLAASIPLPQAKILRLFRIFRAYRLMREYGPSNMLADFVDNRAQSALLFVFLLIVLLLEFGGMGMVWAEQDAPNANIKTGGDSLWFAYVTITTVGYGDEYPVTTAGRIIGVFILTMGVGLFGVLTGFLANFFLTPRRRPLLERRQGTPSSRVMIAQIRHAIDLNEKQQTEIRQRLDELERML